MNINPQEFVQELIAYAVVTDKSSLVKLLNRNGVKMPNNPSDKEVTVAVVAASSRSANFKKELQSFLSEITPKASEDYSSFVGGSSDFGFTGIDDFSFTGIEGFSGVDGFMSADAAPSAKGIKKAARKASRVTADNPQGKTTIGLLFQNIGEGLLSKDTINQGIGIGLTALNNKVQSKNNTIQQQAAEITEREDLLKTQLPSSKINTKTSTMTWVLVGLGVAALATTVYFVTKKK